MTTSAPPLPFKDKTATEKTNTVLTAVLNLLKLKGYEGSSKNEVEILRAELELVSKQLELYQWENKLYKDYGDNNA